MDVVVPAHNEEFVITGCLDRLADATSVNRVIVVANGCTDRTVELARAHPSAPEVVVVERPGKAGALNAGDARCATFPRVYLDADIELSGPGLDALATTAKDTDAEAVMPAVRLDLAGASWPVRRYYAVWQRLPAVNSSSAGRGVYLLTATAHERVFPMPTDLISDDGYVSQRVPQDSRALATEAVVVVKAPKDVRSLLRRRQRVHQGNTGLPQGKAGSTGLHTMAELVRTRQAGPVDVLVFVGITALARLLVRTRRGPVEWGTDQSTRTAVAVDS
ncbi:glycosyltransferase family 2 protein [Actinokineospora sp. NBRC 105648]|uniref:glycosyltransferase n=1 Tax=Actinokineospora sp. NBRC 105648 TaxID=3032206 RepID=UPI0024A0CF03|nr:glycosyltransferase family 2 protein [Actinokineospora sp. NBRC 105648]GLZ39300.1 hypothetical protein Acsp05_29240 [Actinokineospora sp. NBRC 105648]